MTTQEAQQYLISQLTSVYDSREATNIADWVMEYITGWKKMDRVIYKANDLPALQMQQLQQITGDLLKHKPVQYVLGEAWFYGMRFYVNESVLIPRPETEELVEWIINDTNKDKQLSILDIGTGSGCIPIALKKNLLGSKVEACDISEEALAVAKKNAKDLDAEVIFHSLNILNEKERNLLGKYDVIVSNPPYIPLQEKAEMDKHVVDYEPHLALFVEDNNPLVFYKTIRDLSIDHLVNGGSVYFETHMDLASEVAALFNNDQFISVEIKKDLQGRNRMVKAIRFEN